MEEDYSIIGAPLSKDEYIKISSKMFDDFHKEFNINDSEEYEKFIRKIEERWDEIGRILKPHVKGLMDSNIGLKKPNDLRKLVSDDDFREKYFGERYDKLLKTEKKLGFDGIITLADIRGKTHKAIERSEDFNSKIEQIAQITTATDNKKKLEETIVDPEKLKNTETQENDSIKKYDFEEGISNTKGQYRKLGTEETSTNTEQQDKLVRNYMKSNIRKEMGALKKHNEKVIFEDETFNKVIFEEVTFGSDPITFLADKLLKIPDEALPSYEEIKTYIPIINNAGNKALEPLEELRNKESELWNPPNLEDLLEDEAENKTNERPDELQKAQKEFCDYYGLDCEKLKQKSKIYEEYQDTKNEIENLTEAIEHRKNWFKSIGKDIEEEIKNLKKEIKNLENLDLIRPEAQKEFAIRHGFAASEQQMNQVIEIMHEYAKSNGFETVSEITASGLSTVEEGYVDLGKVAYLFNKDFNFTDKEKESVYKALLDGGFNITNKMYEDRKNLRIEHNEFDIEYKTDQLESLNETLNKNKKKLPELKKGEKELKQQLDETIGSTNVNDQGLYDNMAIENTEKFSKIVNQITADQKLDININNIAINNVSKERGNQIS